jgi:hypothetical protein
MNDTTNSPVCERISDLMAFLYNEMNERETRDFRLHLQECSNCREEVASFGLVRESIAAWRDEALAGFVSTPLTVKRSALAALRQFFDLSPLWLKGATAFALVTFCVVTGLAIVRLKTSETVSTSEKPGAIYTEQDVDRIVKEALAKQEKSPVEKAPETVVAVKSPRPKTRSDTRPAQTVNGRRPLSRAEREQLAADLRLLSTDDDTRLNLLGDRINQPR